MTSSRPAKIAICVNPMAGRDVRRVAARASTVTFEAKMDCVARIAAGADAMCIDEIVVTREPFRIAERALEWMDLDAKVTLLDIGLKHDLSDTERAIRAFQAQGVDHIVALGGDGTHRIIARTAPDICLIPLSTGTNNVFPLNVEPTIAGQVATLGARGLLPKKNLRKRVKIAKLTIGERIADLGLIDVVRVEEDFVGNFRPFDTSKLKEMVLTRAEPDAIGMSPIGGLVQPVEERDEFGLYVKLGAGRPRRVPVSPGHFRNVQVAETKSLKFGERRTLEGRGLIAIDGDRLHQIEEGEHVSVTVAREGPYVYDVREAMHYASKEVFA